MPGCEFGVCENVVLNIPAGLPRSIVNIVLIISTMITYVLLLAPVREYYEVIAIKHIQMWWNLSRRRTYWITNVLRSIMVFATGIIATIAPYFADLLGAVGGISDSYLAYILPSMVVITVFYQRKSTRRSSTDYFICGVFCVILLWGVILMCSTIYSVTVNCVVPVENT